MYCFERIISRSPGKHWVLWMQWGNREAGFFSWDVKNHWHIIKFLEGSPVCSGTSRSFGVKFGFAPQLPTCQPLKLPNLLKPSFFHVWNSDIRTSLTGLCETMFARLQTAGPGSGRCLSLPDWTGVARLQMLIVGIGVFSLSSTG